jgi:hypothetical protein
LVRMPEVDRQPGSRRGIIWALLSGPMNEVAQ